MFTFTIGKDHANSRRFATHFYAGTQGTRSQGEECISVSDCGWRKERKRAWLLESVERRSLSIGGGEHLPVTMNYVVVRGKIGQCIELLEKALVALRECPE
jgi:hypothetical protein